MDEERTAEDPLITVLKLFHTKLWDNEMRLWGHHQYSFFLAQEQEESISVGPWGRALGPSPGSSICTTYIDASSMCINKQTMFFESYPYPLQQLTKLLAK